MSIIKNLYNIYKNSANEKQSLSQILNIFSQLPKDYNNEINNVNKYSNILFSELTDDEKEEFIENKFTKIKSLVTNSIYDKEGLVWNFKDIYNLINDSSYSNIEKLKRKVIYSAISNHRPIGDIAYDTWNGLQIIDIDIKNEDLSNQLKPLLFETLSKYNWFLGIFHSASKKSLHIWTKITPITTVLDEERIEFLVNFRQKYSYIYIALAQYSSKFGYTSEQIIEFMDMAMAKPQQGIFIASDKNGLINTNFNDLRLDINFESAINNGIESIDWINHPELKNVFSKLEWFANAYKEKSLEIDNIDEIGDRDITKNKKIHYKHNQRWQLANTLNALFGESNALKIMLQICQNTPYNELKGDVHTAAIHDKPISLWAIKELNKNHGFNIKLKEETIDKNIDSINEKIKNEQDNSIDPTFILNENIEKTTLYLKNNQFLSHIKDDIVKNLGKITLIEAGAGYGKTEMIKSLKEKTLLILPFTSTIKAKVEASEVTKDWLYYYGSKKPSLEEILGDKNMSMTIDKFSRLNIMELDQANFEYIVIDESHLLFTSSYRSVMSPTIQRLANCKAKVIMMTGTPTGEKLFFPGIKNIRVIKDDLRVKNIDIHMCNTKEDKMIIMCQHMADDIIEGKKILFPCNDGNLYYEQIIALLQEILIEKKYYKKLCSFYYKKSNYGDESMIDIEVNKSIGTNDIIVCTNYLSVGVDICDKYKFAVYFDKLWMPQHTEQFANRIRNNDLFINIYLEKYDSNNNPINYNITHKLDLNFDLSTLLFVKDVLRTCNDMLERNSEESKYNPIISSLLSTNNHIKYDENDAKYYIDETALKLKIFEERYSEYSTQLNVLINNLKYYGYTINIINRDSQNEIIINRELVEQKLKECRKSHFNTQTINTFKFLNHINDENIDIYKDILNGSYNIFTDDEYKEIRIENNIYAEDLEVVLKNLPIYLTLYKFYSPEIIIEIFEYCKDKKTNRINYSMLNRIRRFVTIEENRMKKRIDFPVLKYIIEAQKFAQENNYVEKSTMTEWIGQYTTKICNTIKDVIIDDTYFLDEIYNIAKELFDIVVVKKGTKNGLIHIEPFKLLWEKKIDFSDVFGQYANSKEFFLQDLINNIKENSYDDSYVDDIDFEHTTKLKLDNDILEDVKNLLSKSFEYYHYSEVDGSNERFLRKQRNTNHFKDDIFSISDDFNDNIDMTLNTQMDLFKNEK